jgi:sec-independent protein translocase protein TatC
VLCFIVAAIITPPDIVSQVMVALPMLALYELSIGLCILSYHPHADEGEDAEESDEPAQAAV